MPLKRSPVQVPADAAVADTAMLLVEMENDLEQIDQADVNEFLDVTNSPNPAKRPHVYNSPVVELHMLQDLLNKSGEDARLLAASSAAAASEQQTRLHEQLLAQMRADREAYNGRHDMLDAKIERAVVDIDKTSDAVDRAARSLDLTFRSVPVTGRESTEDLRAIVLRIGQVLQVPLDQERLIHVFSVLPRAGTQREPMLIARFGSAGTRHMFFNAYFARKALSTLDLGFSANQRVYISENLTRQNSVLRGKATALKKAGRIANFSTRDGIVRVIAQEGGRPRPIFNDADLEQCIQDGPRAQKRTRDVEMTEPETGVAQDRALALVPVVPVGPSSGPSGLAGEIRKMAIEAGNQ